MSEPTTRYATTDDFSARKGSAGSRSFTASEMALWGSALDAASRMIDDITADFFYSLPSTTLYFTAKRFDAVITPSLQSITTLQTDSAENGSYATTWASSDYALYPYNAAALGKPYTEIRINATSTSRTSTFPFCQRGVKVTGTWGWSTVPAPVKEVCLLEAQRIVEQSASPSGVVASADLGQFLVMPKMHPTSMLLLRPYIRLNGVSIMEAA